MKDTTFYMVHVRTGSMYSAKAGPFEDRGMAEQAAANWAGKQINGFDVKEITIEAAPAERE